MDEAREQTGLRSRFETWAVWLIPLVAAGVALGGWYTWRWWTAPAPYACPYLF